MTRIRYPSSQQIRLMREYGHVAGDVHASPLPAPSLIIKRSRYGYNPTSSDLTTTQVTLRRASQQKTRRKPSMPKMPWEEAND